MGAAVSLRFALEERVEAVRRSVASFVSSRSSARESARESRRSSASDEGTAEGQIDIEWRRDRQSTRSSRSGGTLPASHYGSPLQVLTSKFVLAQMVFNVISSVVCSLFLFYMLFVVFVVPAGEPLLIYAWTDPNLIGVVIGSVLVVSPTLVMILAPAGLVEAVEKKWIPIVRYADCPPWLLTICPFLGAHERWRRGMRRHVALGVMLSSLFIPVPLVLARFVVADADGCQRDTPGCRQPGVPAMSTWTLIWFDIAYETVLALPCTALGLLSFAMEPNYERVKQVMSTPGATQPHPLKRLAHRVFVGCLRLLW